ncbi:HAD family hydrolase [Thermomonospora umbrina]|uniref:Putative hydrolase of the HAD superfamily n=1 Tax=Thermomonospora umbrina TaxID=111806 RepID=A0A3D9SVN3_9ACTN|nr:HAD family hydrolase [Thermomonospora umbrina]REE98560.1 putative hydrolase of the HAD superfamily [Thermomonospora umbrina]
MIKAVLWDFDDTIFDFSGSERRGLLRHLAAEGLPSDEDAFDRWRRLANVQYRRFLSGELTFEEQRRERVRAFLDRPLSDSEADAWFDRYIALFEAAWSVFPDAAPVLAALPHRHGMLSNSSTHHQERRSTALGLRHHFEVLLCSDRLGCAKPDPRAFLAACEALNLPPADVAYVGDRLDVDAMGARDAGLLGIWLDRQGSDDPVPEGVHRISGLDELAALLTPG